MLMAILRQELNASKMTLHPTSPKIALICSTRVGVLYFSLKCSTDVHFQLTASDVLRCALNDSKMTLNTEVKSTPYMPIQLRPYVPNFSPLRSTASYF